jgi:hypothetical protein
MRRIGFEFQEIMSGSYTLTGKNDHTGEVRFQARAHAKSALAHLRDGMATLDGTIDMEHFADDVPFTGTIEIRPLLGKIIRYELSFVGNDGQPYRFAGQKDIQLGHFVATMTTLNGSFYDARGNEIARATLHFDVKADLLPFLVSFKPAVA